MSDKVLVTGAAGFIGAALSEQLLERGDTVIGVDNLSDYYDVRLKQARLARLVPYPAFRDVRLDIADDAGVEKLFAQEQPKRVINLAAQAGVRYAAKNPRAYTSTNVAGFLNVLEGCRRHDVTHLVFASSSSVYGANRKLPFSVHSNVDHPVSLYAATKKADELMAHAYSHLYGIPTTGLRFFTVYGPWGRPDMSLFLFVRNILEGKPIDVYNYGNHRRDFTYIDDIVDGIVRVLDRPAEPNPEWHGESPDPATSNAPWAIYNIGNNNSVELVKYIEIIERCLGKTAEKNMLPMQPGDVIDTWADVGDLARDFDYSPGTSVEVGVQRFVEWYKEYYGID